MCKSSEHLLRGNGSSREHRRLKHFINLGLSTGNGQDDDTEPKSPITGATELTSDLPVGQSQSVVALKVVVDNVQAAQQS